MADVPKEVEAIARQSWEAAQRIGMRIAALPLDQREEGFAIAERSFRDAAGQMGIAGNQIEGFVKLQMDAIRGWVSNIDVGGNPQGGKA
jgi:hypothetical protein